MNKLNVLIILLLSTIVLSGCSGTKGFTYTIDEKNSVKVRLDLSDEFDMDEKSPFTVSKAGKEVCTGIFFSADAYNNYMIAITKDTNTSIIKQGEIDEITYILYEYNTSKNEYNYLIKFKETGIGLILRNNISLVSSQECFEHLSFSK